MMARELAKGRSMAGRRRAGSILTMVLVTTVILGILGLALVERSIRSSATAGWSRDHAVLRSLAQSAAEELYLDLQRRCNLPRDPVFEALRKASPSPTALQGLAATMVLKELEEQGKSLGASLRLSHGVFLAKVLPVTREDPLERSGLVAIEAAVQLERGRTVVKEQVRQLRAFRVARVTPPRPFDQVGLFVVRTSKRDLKSFKGSWAYAAARQGPRTLIDLMTQRSADGFQPVPASLEPAIARALSTLERPAREVRAHLVVSSAAELTRLLSSQLSSGGAVNGFIHVHSTEPVKLAFPDRQIASSFRGKCLISFSGAVEVGEISIEDPRRDSLTIVSTGPILVTGRRIDASLINTSNRKNAVIFQQRCRIRGTVVAGRFPGAASLSVEEFGNCQFQANVDMGSGSSPESAPDRELLACYVALLAPYPVSVEHSR